MFWEASLWAASPQREPAGERQTRGFSRRRRRSGAGGGSASGVRRVSPMSPAGGETEQLGCGADSYSSGICRVLLRKPGGKLYHIAHY
ncbi:hypothetical protein EYF80_015882 [Liparis tanakae]|uniref:Uncharacterized protein n=1 Tax=Liparis tanakae TaxID=230148 RepID=A0A4Z2I8X8_9TELE|nr:hypothetical protein EYF80_015882 [Liparis tanakae]